MENGQYGIQDTHSPDRREEFCTDEDVVQWMAATGSTPLINQLLSFLGASSCFQGSGISSNVCEFSLIARCFRVMLMDV